MNADSLELDRLARQAREIKRTILEVACRTQTHHAGCAFSIVETLVTLYFKILRCDPNRPKDKNRDRFLLSKGHGCLALYAVLAARGFFTPRELADNYGVDGGTLGMHPDRDAMPGIEISSGSLGHGLSIGAGLALAAKIDTLPYRTYVLMGDGECNEGSVWEAALFAAHQRLDNLVAIIDYNHWQGFGKTEEVMDLNPLADKWQAFGWHAETVDGHSLAALLNVFEKVRLIKGRPSMIIAETIKGKGLSTENTLEAHYGCPTQQEVAEFIKTSDPALFQKRAGE